MASPCKKCGATKTESVRHGFLYSLAKSCDYHLRKCSRCQRLRLLPRHSHSEAKEELTDTATPSDPAADPEPQPETQPAEAGQPAELGRPDDIPQRGAACPRCGFGHFRRSRRRWWERLIGRPPMVRCQKCRQRFPKPGAEEMAD